MTTGAGAASTGTDDALRELRLENRLRFLLLMAAAATAVLAFGESIWYSLLWDVEDPIRDSCAANAAPGAGAACYEPENRERVLWSFSSTAGVLAVTTTLALLSSAIRRRHLRPLPLLPGVDPEVVAPVLQLHGMSGVPVVRSARRPTATARADGIRARYIEVGVNWMAYALTDPPRARAVLAHECAHLTGRDILIARISYWLGPVLLVWAIAYAVGISILVSPDLTDAWLRLAILLPVVHVARLAVLRGREHGADMVAAEHERQGLNTVLGSGLGPTGWTRAWRAVADPHPTPASRRAVIDAPGIGPRIAWWDGAVAGLVIGIAGPVLGWQWATWFSASGGVALWGGLVGWGVVGSAAGAWCAVVIAGLAAVERRSGRRTPRLGLFSLAAGAGLAVGQAVFRGPIIGYLDRSEFVPRSALGFAGLAVLCASLPAMVQVLLAVARVSTRVRPGMLSLLGIPLGAVLLGTGGALAQTARTFEALGSSADVDGLLGTLLAFSTSLPGYMLLALALVLALVFVSASGWPSPTAVLRGAAVATVAGMVASAMVAIVAVRAGPAATRTDNWYAAQLSVLMFTYLPIVAALLVGFAATVISGNGFVQRAIGFSVAGGVLAATAPTFVLGTLHDRPAIPLLTFHLPRVVPLVFLGAILASGLTYSVICLLPRRPGLASRVWLAISAFVCTGVVAGIVAWLTPTAVPSTSQDVDSVWTDVIKASAAYSVCGSVGSAPDPAARAALDEHARALSDQDSWSRPATVAGREVRRLATDLEQKCRSAFLDAANRTPPTIALERALDVEAAWRRTRDAATEFLAEQGR